MDIAKTVIFVPTCIDRLAQLMRRQCGKSTDDPWVTLSDAAKRRWLKKAEAVVAGL